MSINLANLIQLSSAFALGVSVALAAIIAKARSKTFKIRRFYAYLPQARDVYNQVAFQFDKQFADFKLLKMALKHDKKHNAYVLEVKYKSLNGKRFSF